MRRIRTRLVVAFLCVSLLPAIPLSLAVRNLLERSFNPTLDAELEAALEAGLAESRERLAEKRARLERWLPLVAAGEIRADETEGDVVVRYLAPDGRSLLHAAPPDAPDGTAAGEELRAWAVAHGERVADEGGAWPISPERVENTLALLARGPGGRRFVLAEPLPAGMADRAARMTDGLRLLRLLREDRPAVLRGYVAPFLVVYGLLILLAAAVGALLARWLAHPLEALAAGTRRVAEGDLETRVEAAAPGEVGDLVRAFNRMLERLSAQRRELARLERVAAWRDMARTLAHEIKNPLTPILLAVQSAKDAYRGGDESYAATLAECEEIVREEVEGLRGLVREFSEFARLPEPVLVAGDLGPLLEEVQRLYGEERLTVRGAGVPLVCPHDAAELRRALVNLVDNGLAACAEAAVEPRVEILARRAGDVMLVEVGDRGCGIPAEHLSRIFEPSFTTKPEGMGLGMCIVESIVRGHGGEIVVRSEPGRGTTITLRLPAGDGAAAAPDAAATAGEPDDAREEAAP